MMIINVFATTPKGGAGAGTGKGTPTRDSMIKRVAARDASKRADRPALRDRPRLPAGPRINNWDGGVAGLNARGGKPFKKKK